MNFWNRRKGGDSEAASGEAQIQGQNTEQNSQKKNFQIPAWLSFKGTSGSRRRKPAGGSSRRSGTEGRWNEKLSKEILGDRGTLALILSVLALSVSLITYLNQESSAVRDVIRIAERDTERALTVDEVMQHMPVTVRNRITAEIEEKAASAVVPETGTAPAVQPVPAGLTFAGEEEFRDAVARAIAQIRRDEAKQVMENKFKVFESAREAVPYGRKIYGNPEARFMIREFSDLECPYCREFFSVPKEVADLSDGQVAVEWIHTPLSFHEPAATREAIAAECVFEQKGNRAFWVAMNEIFSTTQGNGRGTEILGRFVDYFDLDRDEYLNCINSEEMRKRISDSAGIAVQYGITGTPAVVITDKVSGQARTLSGSQPAGALMQVIEEMNAAGERVVETQTQAADVHAPVPPVTAPSPEVRPLPALPSAQVMIGTQEPVNQGAMPVEVIEN